MKFTSSIRDPIYGVVPITSIEQEILKLPLMNRLKDIKQLGLAYLAFSGANHTRFEHSIGAMHVAYMMAQALGLEDTETETLRIAALLHDVGHPPFSHSIEFACRMFKILEIVDHKEATRTKILEDHKLHDILKETRPLIHIQDIANLAVGKLDILHLKAILDGAIDADKIDYILRDNYHCGFPVSLDINTITEILCRDEKRGIGLLPEGQSFAEQLFMGRFHLISKIHHNRRNRLGNYLLALTLGEAWETTSDKTTVARDLFETWTDADLLAFLAKSAEKRFQYLKNFLLGEEIFHEVYNFGYFDLTPYARYSAAVLSRQPSFFPEISKELSKRAGMKSLFLDAYVASPPELDLTIGTDPPQFVIDTPLSKGIVDSSLSEVHVALYSFEKILDKDLDFKALVTEYSTELDNTLDMKKAKGLLDSWWKGDQKSFCLHKASELVLNIGSVKLRSVRDISSDIVLNVASALYDSFQEVFGRVVYLESLSQMSRLLIDLKNKDLFTKSSGKKMDFYDIPVEEHAAIVFPSQFLVDIEMLEIYGLMYRLIRVAKFGEKFSRKYQMRISGWGRGYYSRNLSQVHELLSLHKRLKEHLMAILEKNEELYKKYFDMVDRERSSREIAIEARELLHGRKLPIRVVV